MSTQAEQYLEVTHLSDTSNGITGLCAESLHPLRTVMRLTALYFTMDVHNPSAERCWVVDLHPVDLQKLQANPCCHRVSGNFQVSSECACF